MSAWVRTPGGDELHADSTRAAPRTATSATPIEFASLGTQPTLAVAASDTPRRARLADHVVRDPAVEPKPLRSVWSIVRQLWGGGGRGHLGRWSLQDRSPLTFVGTPSPGFSVQSLTRQTRAFRPDRLALGHLYFFARPLQNGPALPLNSSRRVMTPTADAWFGSIAWGFASESRRPHSPTGGSGHGRTEGPISWVPATSP